MRIWSLHPQHLDAKGLVDLWRETLLAQKALRGETRGYRNHPQLARFKSYSEPLEAIAAYLQRCSAKRQGAATGSMCSYSCAGSSLSIHQAAAAKPIAAVTVTVEP